MFVIASTTPVPPPKNTTVQNIKRMKRQMESKRMEHIKKIQETVKEVSKAEIEYIKSLLPTGLLDEDDD